MRYLKNRVDGFIYEYNDILAANPKCYEVSEQEAFPERFKGQVSVGLAAARAAAAAPSPLTAALATTEVISPQQQELNNDATRGLPGAPPVAAAVAGAPLPDFAAGLAAELKP